MFTVFWMAPVIDEGELIPHCQMFEDMGKALEFSNEARSMGARFVCMASEVEGNMTKMGVSGPSPNYEWFKRRDSLRVGRREFLESLKVKK